MRGAAAALAVGVVTAGCWGPPFEATEQLGDAGGELAPIDAGDVVDVLEHDRSAEHDAPEHDHNALDVVDASTIVDVLEEPPAVDAGGLEAAPDVAGDVVDELPPNVCEPQTAACGGAFPVLCCHYEPCSCCTRECP